MVKIRLKRMGMKKMPFYRLVVIDSRSARDSRAIEEVGYYNPMTQPAEIKVELTKWEDGGEFEVGGDEGNYDPNNPKPQPEP